MIPDDVKGASEEGEFSKEMTLEKLGVNSNMFPHLLGLGMCHTHTQIKGRGAQNMGGRLVLAHWGFNVKMGGRGEGHPISHVLLPALVTQGMEVETELWRENPAPPPLTLLTQTQPFIFLPFLHSLPAGSPWTSRSGGAAP